MHHGGKKPNNMNMKVVKRTFDYFLMIYIPCINFKVTKWAL